MVEPKLATRDDEAVQVIINKIETEYRELHSDGRVSFAPELIRMNVTAVNVDMKVTMDMEFDPIVLVRKTADNTPDFMETARKVIRCIDNGWGLGKRDE